MRASLTVFAAVVLLAACSESGRNTATQDVNALPPFVIADTRLTEPLSGMRMGAGYLTLTNNSAQDIRITRVHGVGVDSVEMHESILEDGVSRMEKLPGVVVPAGQSVLFEPGAKHLMLRYPESIPRQVTLQFFAGEDLLLAVTTRVNKD